ncbi:MAG: type II toxin-antitoxin system MqsA family antitoxin [Polyangiaceae bacterium]|nr:type II toxin-antitoxin system MqsA family antitoxin [Polyangiaceae bacterium]
MGTNLSKCVSCGFAGKLEATSEDESVTVGSHTFTGVIPAERCPKCDEIYTDASDHRAFACHVARALIDAGEVSGSVFRFFRHTLGLTEASLANLLGVSADTVSRWERGQRDVDRLAWATVAGLVFDEIEERPRMRHVLEVMRTPGPPLAKAVRLDGARPTCTSGSR